MTGGDTEATRAAKRLGEERGLDVVLFGGGNLSIQQNGRTVSAQAFISGNRVYVRADHPDYTAYQLMRHEAGHDMIAKGELDPATVRQRIAESFGEAKLDQLAELYSAAYRSSDLTPSEVWEEVVCDSLGDMNIFHDIPVMEEHAQELLDETKKAAGADIETMRVRGPPTAAAEDKASRYFDYESVSRQAWSQIQSRRMAKYGGHFDEMPRIDTLHAHDKLYLIENFDESSFSVLKVVDPSEDQNLANYFTEETKNGNIRDAATSRKGARELRSRGGERARNRPYDGYTGAAKENAGLYAQRGGTEESVQSSGEGFGDRSEYRTDSQGRKLSEAQQAYFRDSAVRDEDGRLLPVYHATYADEFTVFDREKLGENTDGNATDESWAATSHIGFWFSSKNLSRKSGLGSRAETVYLNITNPFYADSLESLAAQMEQYEGGPAERGEAFADWLRSDGYDGVVVQDEEFGGTSYVALESEQAKRITNQNPTGDPDIRFSQDLAELEALRKENERLKSRVERGPSALHGRTPFALPQRDVQRHHEQEAADKAAGSGAGMGLRDELLHGDVEHRARGEAQQPRHQRRDARRREHHEHAEQRLHRAGEHTEPERPCAAPPLLPQRKRHGSAFREILDPDPKRKRRRAREPLPRRRERERKPHRHALRHVVQRNRRHQQRVFPPRRIGVPAAPQPRQQVVQRSQKRRADQHPRRRREPRR